MGNASQRQKNGQNNGRREQEGYAEPWNSPFPYGKADCVDIAEYIDRRKSKRNDDGCANGAKKHPYQREQLEQL